MVELGVRKKRPLTGGELFRCRVAIALGKLPSEIASIPTDDYDLLLRYWDVEPWGAWRDNFHAAMIAAQVRAPYMRKGATNALSDFMYMDPDLRRRQRLTGLVQALRAAGQATARRAAKKSTTKKR